MARSNAIDVYKGLEILRSAYKIAIAEWQNICSADRHVVDEIRSISEIVLFAKAITISKNQIVCQQLTDEAEETIHNP